MKKIKLDYALLELGKGSLRIQVFTSDIMRSVIQPDRNRSWLVKDFEITHDDDQTIRITGKRVRMISSRMLIGNHWYFSSQNYDLMDQESKDDVKKIGPFVFSPDPVQLTSEEHNFNRIYFNYPIEIVPVNDNCLNDACSIAAIVGSRGLKNERIVEEPEQQSGDPI